MKPLTLLIALIYILVSCTDFKQGKFEITNSTAIILDSVYIEPNKNHPGKYITLKPNETVSYFTDMSEETNDGLHYLQFKLNSKKVNQNLTYYSNGNSMEKLTRIKIQPDTILVFTIY